MNEENKPKMCSHHKVILWALVITGVVALLADLNLWHWSAFYSSLPFVLCIIGIMTIMCSKTCKCKKCEEK